MRKSGARFLRGLLDDIEEVEIVPLLVTDRRSGDFLVMVKLRRMEEEFFV